MLRTGALVVLAVAALGAGAVQANQPPLAEAGLDQHVAEGSTVRLDAGGSTDPDGEVAQYRWHIEAPNGTAVSAACPTCERTRFVARQNGTYAVTVAVTDDDGATRSDTLYVTATERDPPSVELRGPGVALSGAEKTYTASVTAGAEQLTGLMWFHNGTRIAGQRLSGHNASRSRTLSLTATGEQTLRAVAVDANGWTGSAERTVEIQSRDGSMPALWASPDGLDGTDRIVIGEDHRVRSGDTSPDFLSPSEVDGLQQMDGVTVGTNTQGIKQLEVTNDAVQEEIRTISRGSGATSQFHNDFEPNDVETISDDIENTISSERLPQKNTDRGENTDEEHL